MLVNGNGFTAPATGMSNYPCGTEVNITASANPGWDFTRWDSTGSGVANPYSPNTSVQVYAITTVTAIFAPTPTPSPTPTPTPTECSLTMLVKSSGPTATEVWTSYCTCGTHVEIHAPINSGWNFTGWTSTGGTVADPNSPNTFVTVSSNTTVTANFAPAATPTETACDKFQTDWEVIQLAVSTFVSDLHAGWKDINGDDNPHNPDTFSDNVWGRTTPDTEGGHYFPTAIGVMGRHVLTLSTTQFDPMHTGNALILGAASGEAAYDAEIQLHAIWMGLLVNAAGSGTTSSGSQDRARVSVLAVWEGQDYLDRIPDSAMAGNGYNGAPSPGGSYCWVVGGYNPAERSWGQVYGAYKSTDGNWYSGCNGSYP